MKFATSWPRALFPGFGGGAGFRRTSKAREKRRGDEVVKFVVIEGVRGKGNGCHGAKL